MFLLTQYCIGKVKRKTIQDEPEEKSDGPENKNLHKFGHPGQGNQPGSVPGFFSILAFEQFINGLMKEF
jgi:hypothetical protein